jgi:methionyl-tRNA formyltransferase
MTAQMAGETVKVWQAHVQSDASSTSQGAQAGTLLAINDQGLLVACGEGVLCLTQLQKPGGKRQPVADFVRHFKGVVGDVFQS